MLTPDELAALPVEQMQRLFTEQTLRDVYDYESHVRIGEDLDGRGALPATFMSLAPGSWTPDVWRDVDRMRTLNGDQRRRNVQMHVCPLQFDIVERLIRRYSNPGDLVFDPFAGLGAVLLVGLWASAWVGFSTVAVLVLLHQVFWATTTSSVAGLAVPFGFVVLWWLGFAISEAARSEERARDARGDDGDQPCVTDQPVQQCEHRADGEHVHRCVPQRRRLARPRWVTWRLFQPLIIPKISPLKGLIFV